MSEYKYIHSAYILREGRTEAIYILINKDRIEKLSPLPLTVLPQDTQIIDASGFLALPGVIDTHVHFRQPGAEYKATMRTESSAALAGGVTTVLDMPNNTPQITTLEALEEKIQLAKKEMQCNYGLFFGITNDNIQEALSIPEEKICGYKLFLGSSTGNMLVNNKESIEKLFRYSHLPISAHCEDEQIISTNLAKYKAMYAQGASAQLHPMIRSSQACIKSTKFAIKLAQKYSTHLNIAHLTTKEEVELFSGVDHSFLTCEVTPNHLYFTDEDYLHFGNLLKCNPAVKSKEDCLALRSGLKSGAIDIVASDHAPHLLSEKQQPYFSAPSGIPSIQHTLQMMLDLVACGIFTIEEIEEKMCHRPAQVFHIKDRGYLKEGYFADIVLVDTAKPYQVTKQNTLYKCGWSLLEGKTLSATIKATYLNGQEVFHQ